MMVKVAGKISMEVNNMSKKRANHVRPGMNAAKGQGAGAGYNNEEMANEPLTGLQKQNNKKRKKNQ